MKSESAMKRTAINYLSIIGVLLIAGSMLSCSPQQAEPAAAQPTADHAVTEQEDAPWSHSGIPSDAELFTAMQYAHFNPDVSLDSIKSLDVDCRHLPNLYDRAANEEQRQAIAYIGARLCEDVDHWVGLYMETPLSDGEHRLLDDRFAAQALYTVYLESGSEKALDWLLNGRSDGALATEQTWHAHKALYERPFEVLKRLETLENGEMPHEESATKFSRWLLHMAPNEIERQQIKQIRDRVCSADPNGFGCRYMDAYIKSIE